MVIGIINSDPPVKSPKRRFQKKRRREKKKSHMKFTADIFPYGMLTVFRGRGYAICTCRFLCVHTLDVQMTMLSQAVLT